jgi:hypothetical protein
MTGDQCVAIAADRRFSLKMLTVTTDCEKIFQINDRIFLGRGASLVECKRLARGNQQIGNVSFPFAASILSSCADTPMRLIASHGPAQSQCLTIVTHWSTKMVTGFHYREH